MGSFSLEVTMMEICVLEALLPVTVLCVKVEFGDADSISDDVILDVAEDEDIGDPLLEVFERRLCVPGIVLPVVVEFVVHKDAMIWPMVAAGTSNDDIKIARDLAPAWEGEDL